MSGAEYCERLAPGHLACRIKGQWRRGDEGPAVTQGGAVSAPGSAAEHQIVDLTVAAIAWQYQLIANPCRHHVAFRRPSFTARRCTLASPMLVLSLVASMTFVQA
jgi:hypothetical protein